MAVTASPLFERLRKVWSRPRTVARLSDLSVPVSKAFTIVHIRPNSEARTMKQDDGSPSSPRGVSYDTTRLDSGNEQRQ